MEHEQEEEDRWAGVARHPPAFNYPPPPYGPPLARAADQADFATQTSEEPEGGVSPRTRHLTTVATSAWTLVALLWLLSMVRGTRGAIMEMQQAHGAVTFALFASLVHPVTLGHLTLRLNFSRVLERLEDTAVAFHHAHDRQRQDEVLAFRRQFQTEWRSVQPAPDRSQRSMLEVISGILGFFGL